MLWTVTRRPWKSARASIASSGAQSRWFDGLTHLTRSPLSFSDGYIASCGAVDAVGWTGVGRLWQPANKRAATRIVGSQTVSVAARPLDNGDGMGILGRFIAGQTAPQKSTRQETDAISWKTAFPQEESVCPPAEV